MQKQQLWGVRETEQAMEERNVHIGDEITAYIPDFDSVIAYIEPAKDLNRPVAEIIAWRPFPEPYDSEKDN